MFRLSPFVSSLIFAAAIVLSGCVEGAPSAAAGDAGDTGATDAGAMDATLDASVGDAAVDTGGADLGADADASVDAGVDVDFGTFEPTGVPMRAAGDVLHYFPFRDSSAIVDESGNADPITTPAGATVQGGQINLEAGTNFTLPNPLNLIESVTISNAFTLELWIAPQTPDNSTAYVRWNQLTLSQVARGAGTNVGLCLSDCGTPEARSVLAALRPGEMTHVAVTGDGALIRIYVGGALVAAWDVDDVISEFHHTQSGVRVGGAGAMDIALLGLYSRALSPGEVLANSFVGPFPGAEAELSENDSAAVAVISDGALFERGQRLKSIANGEPGSTNELRAADERNAFFFVEHPLPADADVLKSVFLLQTLNAEASGTWRIFEVRRPWTTELTWTSTGSALWEVAGGEGAADRDPEPLAQRVATQGAAFRVFRDVSELSWEWQKGITTNHGFQLTCDGCDVLIASSQDTERVPRPRLVSLLSQERPTAGPSDPSDVTYRLQGGNLAVTWSPLPDDVEVEVFVNGRLAKRSQKDFAEIVGFNRTVESVRVVAVDLWGRASGFVVAQPR